MYNIRVCIYDRLKWRVWFSNFAHAHVHAVYYAYAWTLLASLERSTADSFSSGSLGKKRTLRVKETLTDFLDAQHVKCIFSVV